MNFIIISILFLIQCINCSHLNLQLKLYSFENVYGVKMDRKCCFTKTSPSTKISVNAQQQQQCIRECSTFFRFCIKSSASLKCESEFETDILGGNVITRAHFDQTTNLIQLPLSVHSTHLEIQILNDRSIYVGEKQESDVISKWTLEINPMNVNSQQMQDTLEKSMYAWNVFNMSQLALNQKFAFAYTYVSSQEKNEEQVMLACELPCLNGATCLSNKCLCAPGYTGDQCQLKSLPNTCGTHKKCLHNGTCYLDNFNEYKCMCKNGYSGEQCEVVAATTNTVNICTRDSPCASNGQCKSFNLNEYVCECFIGFSGVNCSDVVLVAATRLNQQTMSTHEIILLTSIGISFPIICILIVIIIARMRRDAKQVTLIEHKQQHQPRENIYVDIRDEKVVKIEIESDNDQVSSKVKQMNFIENNLYDHVYNQKNNKEKCNNKSKIEFGNEKSIKTHDFNLMASIV